MRQTMTDQGRLDTGSREDDLLNESDALLKSVGSRIHLLRSRRGMTRRDLSQHARVSERYLGQLEKGQANATLGLLHRIAETLNEPLSSILPAAEASTAISAPLQDLLASLSEAQQANAYRILVREVKRCESSPRGLALIGMRGAGKSTLGRRLADLCGVSFVRISEVVTSLGGMNIGALLEMTGQNAYRRIEYEALEHIIDNHDRVIVEAGGGLVAEARTFNLLSRHFQTVWIKTSAEEHMQRVIDQGDMRPMAGNNQAMDDLRTILRERDAYYRQADYTLDTSGRSVEDCLNELHDLCEKILSSQAESV